MVLRVWDVVGGVIFLDSTSNRDNITWLIYLNVSVCCVVGEDLARTLGTHTQGWWRRGAAPCEKNCEGPPVAAFEIEQSRSRYSKPSTPHPHPNKGISTASAHTLIYETMDY